MTNGSAIQFKKQVASIHAILDLCDNALHTTRSRGRHNGLHLHSAENQQRIALVHVVTDVNLLQTDYEPRPDGKPADDPRKVHAGFYAGAAAVSRPLEELPPASSP